MNINNETVANPPVVEVLTALTPTDVADFARLLPQLSSTSRTEAEIAQNLHGAISSPTSRIVVIRDEAGRIQASATGNLCPIPTGNKPWIDDVVTDEGHRGLGYGGTLTEALEEWFAENGIASSNLTSNPSRVTAGSLYERMGYRERDTRVYRKILPKVGSTAIDS